MSYTLMIGAQQQGRDETQDVVACKTHPNAPVLGGQSNQCGISYSSFEIFCRETNLLDLYQLIVQAHPGEVVMTRELAQTIHQALRRWSTWHWLPAGRGLGHDRTKLLLCWFDFWAQWALANCERPILANR